MMPRDREAWIRELMERFRAAAKDPGMRAHAGYFDFPNKSCTWASFAFGRLLLEREPDADWHLVNAAGLDGISGHDWLESNGLAVDVTADQFDDHEPYVGPAPPPLPVAYVRRRRIELSDWDPPHANALEDIRRLMADPESQSGG